MDATRLREIKDQLLCDRRYVLASGGLAVLFLLVTMAGGFLLFKQALDDNSPVRTSAVNVPTQVGLLFSYDQPEQVVNQLIFFNDVRLEEGPSDDLYYAVGAAGKRVLVMAKGSKTSSDSGIVDIKGTVRILPSAYVLKTKWKLSKEQVKDAREQGIYVEAVQISGRRALPAKVAKK